SIIHYAFPDITAWWGTVLANYYNEAKVAVSGSPSFMSKDAQLESISTTKQFATGFMTAAILANALMQLMVARWWQSYILMPGSMRRELQHIKLSQLTGVLFIACLIFSYFGNRVIFDIIPVVYLLFLVAGLSVIHYFFGLMKSQTAWFCLMLLYV